MNMRALGYPVDPRETERYRALQKLSILDTPQSVDLDRICALAQRRFGVPIVLVPLLDRERQWFKARIGIDLAQTCREVAFCNHTLMSDDAFVVEDATADPRFAANPLVTGELHLRAYAGVALSLEPGLRLGTFCIIDTRPRRFDPAEIDELKMFAALASEQLRLHQVTRALAVQLIKSEARRALVSAQADEIRRRQLVTNHTERMANVGGWQVDRKADRIFWSDQMFDIYDLPRTTVIDKELASRAYAASDLRTITAAVVHSLQTGESFAWEGQFTTAKGRKRWVSLSGEVERSVKGSGRLLGILRDITEERATASRLWYLANHDDLTGLPGRRILEERIMEVDPASGAALVLVDLDQFKDINDTLGHALGDQVLRETARRVSGLVSGDALVSRFGGDEFCILLPGHRSAAMLAPFLEALLAKLREPLLVEDRVLSCRASVGVTLIPDNSSANEALKNVDMALFIAKTAGRDRFTFYDPAQRARMERRLVVLQTVKEALEDDRVMPYYQPKIAADTGEVVGFEALMRWYDPKQGIRLPGAVAEAFEDEVLAVGIGEAMLAQVLRDMRGWSDDGVPFGHVAVNASAAEFAREGFAGRILAHLAHHGLPSHCLELEVTETVFLGRGADHVGAVLRTLSAHGIAIALDDFGTGYASLSHLKQFPVNCIKVDRSFVSGIETDPDAAAIVAAVIALGRSLGMKSVAEGVETEGQLQFLRERSCDLVQGFLLGRPMPASQVRPFVQAWNPGTVCDTSGAMAVAGRPALPSAPPVRPPGVHRGSHAGR